MEKNATQQLCDIIQALPVEYRGSYSQTNYLFFTSTNR
jgi:hypothetical protein